MIILLFILIISIILIFKYVCLYFVTCFNLSVNIRKIKYNSSLANMSWKVRWEEIDEINLEKLVQNDESKVKNTNVALQFAQLNVLFLLRTQIQHRSDLQGKQ